MNSLLIFATITTVLLSMIFSIAEAAREAKEHHIKVLIDLLKDHLKNKQIPLPYNIEKRIEADYVVEKHFLYSIGRDCFYLMAWGFFYSNFPFHKAIYASLHTLALVLMFRAVHDSFYYLYRYFLDPSLMKYKKGLLTDGDKKNSGIIDALFGNSLFHRSLCLIVSIGIEIFIFLNL